MTKGQPQQPRNEPHGFACSHHFKGGGSAAKAALSRSALYERFGELVGVPPLHYLARWRMQVAVGMLRRGDSGMAEIAAKVSYGSEAAFSRAFCKMMGAPPSAWRKRGAAS